MSGRVAGKIAIVTGASNGIGREISLLLAKEGATVVCSDISPDARKEGFKATHEEITSSGGTSIFHKADVTVESDVEALVQKAVKEYGRLDIMCNNAGIAVSLTSTFQHLSKRLSAMRDTLILTSMKIEDGKAPRPVWEVEQSVFDKTISINTTGVLLGCKHASKVMKDQEPGPSGDRGWIVNTASIMGLVGIPNACTHL